MNPPYRCLHGSIFQNSAETGRVSILYISSQALYGYVKWINMVIMESNVPMLFLHIALFFCEKNTDH